MRDERLAGLSASLCARRSPVRGIRLVIETTTNYSGGGAALRICSTCMSRRPPRFVTTTSSRSGLIRALTEAGIVVGSDFAVIGFDDIDEAKHTLPA